MSNINTELLQKLNHQVGEHIHAYMQAREKLEGFTEQERLDAFISGMNEIRQIVIMAYEVEVNKRAALSDSKETKNHE
jgi:hypothetical protein